VEKQHGKIGQAGSLESCDVRIIVELRQDTERQISIEGPMKDIYHSAIERTIIEVLDELEVTGARLKVIDQGALDYVLRARTETAIARARLGGDGA